MYITLILDEGREVKCKKIEMKKNIISVLEILQSFGIEKLASEEKIWIKRLNFDEFAEKEYTVYSVLEWDKFNSCEIAISPTRPTKSRLNENPKTSGTKSETGSSRNHTKIKALEEMFIINLVLENQKGIKPR